MSDRLVEARRALALGDKSAASNLLRQLVTQEPRNDVAWELLADVVGNREHAVDCLKRAIAFNANNQSAQKKLKVLLTPVFTASTVSAPPRPSPAMPEAKLAEPAVRVQAPPLPAQATATTKRCPYCAEEIQAAAIVCKHCGRDLVTPFSAAARPLPANTPSTSPPPVRRPVATEKLAEEDPGEDTVPRPGSYVDSNLMPGERVLYRAQLHSVIYVRALVTTVFGAVVAAIALSTQRGSMVGFGVLAGLCFGSFLGLAGLIGFVGVFLAIRTTEFALTTRRLIGKRGIIRRHSLELLLNKVESVSVDQPIWGRLLNYGTIVVCGTGGTRERFGYVEDPLKLRQAVQRQIANQ